MEWHLILGKSVWDIDILILNEKFWEFFSRIFFFFFHKIIFIKDLLFEIFVCIVS